MLRITRSFLLSLPTLIFVINEIQAQDEKSIDELYTELDSLFANESIPDLFKLADSILAMDSAKFSSINFRVGYISQVVSSGRIYGFEQFGIIPSISYFHHSGLFVGTTAFWSSEFDPALYLGNCSVGFMKSIKNRFMLSASHDFYFYNDTLPDHSFNKALQGSVYYQTKISDVGIDYTFLYGDETAHRISANLNGRIRLNTKGFLKTITFLPGMSLQWGNANVYYLRQPRTAAAELYQVVKSNDFPRLTLRNYVRVISMLQNDRTLAAEVFLRRRNYTDEQIDTMFDTFYSGVVKNNNVFGFMNYSFSLPVTLSFAKWTATLNYTYNVPVALPGESFNYPPNGFFSTSVSHSIQWPHR